MSFAAVFPGQGSQSLGMLEDLASSHPVFAETYQEASETLGYDVARLITNGPAEELNRTEVTQPVLLAAEVAVWRAWGLTTKERPVALAGHSLGEYTALVASDSIQFGDALRLVRLRGQLMQKAVPEGTGAMAALLGLGPQQVSEICEEAAAVGLVSPANINSPEQVVISGERAAVERAIEIARDRGCKRTVLLPVSVPSHCTLMTPAARELAKSLREIDIQSPRIPVIHNVDVKSSANADEIRDALIRQLTHPVRWVETVEQFRSGYGIDTFVELGPNKVLTGLIRRYDRTLVALSTDRLETFEKAISVVSASPDSIHAKHHQE